MISVVIPAYNCEKYIKDTINSVIEQTFKDLEIIVVNDASTDRTAEIVRELQKTDDRIFLYENLKNLGVSATRNFGVSKASADYIAFLDSDDLWYPEKIEKQLVLLKEKDADFVYSGYDFIDDNGSKLDLEFKVPEEVTFKKILKRNYISTDTVILKKEVFMQHQMQDGNIYVEDYLCWLSILKTGIIAYGVHDILASYRLVHNSRSSKKFKLIIKTYKTLRRAGLCSFSSLFYTMVISINAIRKYGISNFFRRKKKKWTKNEQS